MMQISEQKPKLFLCGGLQSSGSTFISWCFLQRKDMNGYFDANNDILTDISPKIGSPYVWYKTTLSCFRVSELVTYYEEAGWDVYPLLVIRDCRQVWNSLVKKKYGRDGTTAEDPPLRMRFRRFKEDWHYFREKNLPIICFESFVENPENILKKACEELKLAWDESMKTWPKRPQDIANIQHGSRTFKINRSKGLTASDKNFQLHVENILPGDLVWLEKEFEEFNRENHYLERAHTCSNKENQLQRSIPHFQVTRRNDWKLRHKPFRWLTNQALQFFRK